MQRVILAATLSSNYGIYGPAYELCEGRPAKPAPGKTGSEEYLDSEKYQVRNWDRSDPISIAPLITELNRIRYDNLALHANDGLHFHPADNAQIVCYSKTYTNPKTREAANTILTVVNLDAKNEQAAWINLSVDKLGLPLGSAFEVEDLLTGAKYIWSDRSYVALKPALPAHIFRIVR